MSGSRLNISITATDTASGEIKGLQTAIKGLEQNLQQLTTLSNNASATTAASLQREIALIKEKTGALNQELAAKIGASAQGVRAAQTEAEYINRDIDLINKKAQAQIRASNAAAIAQRQAAEDAARYEAESINRTMAAREAAIRASLAANNARVFKEREMEDAAAARAAALARGGGLTLTPAAGFGRRIEEQVLGIQPRLDPTARAQLQRQLEMTFAELEPVAAEEGVLVGAAFSGGMARGVGGGGALLQRESRHIVGLFDSLARGQRGQAISSIGAAARDAGLGVGALSVSIGGLVAVMGGAAIIRGAESMGKWASETRAAASAAGMSIANYSALQGALVLTGEKAGEADTTLRRLAVNLSTALADPASLAAQAFHNLGISQEDLVKTGGDVSRVVDLLSGAFSRTADGANKSANFNELAGRSFEKLFQLVQSGSMTLDEAKNRARALGLTLTDETAAGLEKTGQKADELSASIKGKAIEAFVALGPAIQGALTVLEAFGVGASTVAGQVSTLASKTKGTGFRGA